MPKSKATKNKAVAAKKKLVVTAQRPKKMKQRSMDQKGGAPTQRRMLVRVAPVAASKETVVVEIEVEKFPKQTRASKSKAPPIESLSKMAQKWATLFRKASDVAAAPYSIAAVYEPKTAIMHKVLGWGYILSNRNDRLEVLFKDGIKYLISNYKRD